MRPQLVVMVKEPLPGRVKTRLGRDMGMTGSAWWFRHQVAGLLRRIESPKWETILAVAPDAEGMQSRVWPAHLPRVAQGGGNLGDRMARIFRSAAPGPVCIIGADIPGINQQCINLAFQWLGNHDAVFGPAPDGGYWLVGMKRIGAISPRLFDGVRWSSEFALADSMATMTGLRIAKTTVLRDVDTVSDLNALKHLSR
ncbi:TIGR04282 family arsenosugar biosynthesis glycosyltransferase [Cognatishimia sp. WU-CL00825]|uniref:TIGR04282 family arsenosugar biosynthesis glycosyltransferase n=1 Tax=Cognatishimia sp. WU-CL00825 TaxID=3127658 RepID=UPI003103E5FF